MPILTDFKLIEIKRQFSHSSFQILFYFKSVIFILKKLKNTQNNGKKWTCIQDSTKDGKTQAWSTKNFVLSMPNKFMNVWYIYSSWSPSISQSYSQKATKIDTFWIKMTWVKKKKYHYTPNYWMYENTRQNLKPWPWYFFNTLIKYQFFIFKTKWFKLIGLESGFKHGMTLVIIENIRLETLLSFKPFFMPSPTSN